MHRCYLSFLLVLAVSLAPFPARCTATPMITVGDIELLPDAANQMVDLLVTGGDPIPGMNFNLQIADGGPAAGGTVIGPSVVADLEKNTIFDGNNTGAVNVEDPPLPQAEFATIVTDSGTVAAEGILARLSFDTTGFVTGKFPLLLTATLNGDTDFVDVFPEIENGMLVIVPEPALGLMAIWLCLCCCGRRTNPTKPCPSRHPDRAKPSRRDGQSLADHRS